MQGTYSAEISRSNPACILFLVDQSESMVDPFGGADGAGSKAEGVANAVNRWLYNLGFKCAKQDGVRDYFHVGVIGYGRRVGPAFGGKLEGRPLVPISEIANAPVRIEQRTQQVPDGAGGLTTRTIPFPVWFDPVHRGATPMRQAFLVAAQLARQWAAEHPASFPPLVINVSDGESTDGDPSAAAAEVRAVQTSDGAALAFNVHLSSRALRPIEFPSDEAGLPDEHARKLFRMSSLLPPHLLRAAGEMGYRVDGAARGFAFNADLVLLIKFLDIGTRPANMR